MSVCIVWVENLCFANFLESCACFQNQFYRHLIKDLISICRVISQVQNSFDTSNAACIIGPLVNSLSNFLQRAPVAKDALLAFSCPVGEIIRLHPLANLLKWFHWQAPIDLLVLANFACVELSQTYAIDAFAFAETQDQIAPHFQLTFTSVYVFLDGVKKWPRVVLGQCKIFHFDLI